MRNLIRSGLAAGIAGVLALGGLALAQQNAPPSGSPSSGTGSGAPNSVGQGDTSRPGASPSSGGQGSSSDTGTPGTSAAPGTKAGPSDTGGGPTAGSDRTVTGAPSAGQKIDAKLQSKLEKIHADNLAEAQLGQLAAQNAQSPDVKQFAEKMQTDHQRLDGKLQQILQTMGASLEGKDFDKAQKDNQKDLQQLQSKTGKDFDKDYMSRMVKDHEKDLKVVKDAQKDAEKGKHSELAALLQSAQTGMQGHLDQAKQVQKSVEKAGSTATGPASSGTGSGTNPADSTKPSQPSQGQRESK
ncbi:MAG TPA: DUF4142 domain-containing protein [Anaeromyxobacter sp.]